MADKEKKIIGVIGSGSFGTTIAKLLSINNRVLLYTRRQEVVDDVNINHRHRGIELSPDIRATLDREEICNTCTLIFIAIPSRSFAPMIDGFKRYFKPSHILVHCTKGFDLVGVEEKDLADTKISRDNVRTMSELIIEETNVRRVGCLAGPNLAKEILEGYPTAAVIASQYDEVIKVSQQALDSDKFIVFGSHDIIGAELAGALKNIIALGSGILGGLGMGKNIQAMLITRGLREMIYFGKAMGSESRAFLGTAGIGDLIATATSDKSRNYTVGTRLAKGEKLDEIIASMDEVAEGVRTLRIAQQLAKHYSIHVPITLMLYKIVYEDYDIQRAINFLMRYPYAPDVDFL